VISEKQSWIHFDCLAILPNKIDEIATNWKPI